jgi:hypothetical protein
MAATQISDIIVPQSFTAYTQVLTAQKSKLIQAGAVQRSAFLDNFLAGGGNIVTLPAFKDINDGSVIDSNVATDDTTTSTAGKLGSLQAVVHRMSRNKSWSVYDLAGDLAGADPVQAILGRVSNFWAINTQYLVVQALKGVFAANAASNSSDMIVDKSGASYVAGTTDFQPKWFLNTLAKKGDAFGSLSTLYVHSQVYFKMLEQNLITFQLNSDLNTNVAYYMGFKVVYDDGLPNAAGVFTSYILGDGAVQLGMGSPKVPTEVFRDPSMGTGSGLETLYSRIELAIAPIGHSYAGTTTIGGASATALATAGNWSRVYPESKQVPMLALVTREF